MALGSLKQTDPSLLLLIFILSLLLFKFDPRLKFVMLLILCYLWEGSFHIIELRVCNFVVLSYNTLTSSTE